MDAISKINETLQIIYAFVPQELVIVILACMVMGYLQSSEDKNNAD